MVGSASIQPAHLFLMFLAFATLSHWQKFGIALKALAFPQPGFWFACLLVYGAATGLFSPRLFAGTMEIIPLGVSEYPASDSGTVPLGPVSSNLTQVIYLTADLFCFLLIIAVGSTRSGIQAIAAGLVGYGFANTAFALLDLATYATGSQDLLQFIRNAQYAMHEDVVVGGLKRIVGSWPEASAFAGSTLGVIGFTGTMWLCGRSAGWTGLLCLASIVLTARSTSSVGILALPLCLLLLYGTAIARSGLNKSSRNSSAVVLFTPPIVIAVALIVILSETIYAWVYDYLDLLIFSKTTSASAMERGSWNMHAYENFLASSGLGVGLGTNRTSNFLLALLSNVGVPGTTFFFLFAISALSKRRGTPRDYASDVRLSARNGCLCLLVGSMVAGATVDLGLQFFILAGLACCVPQPEGQRSQSISTDLTSVARET
ncbi:MULTISPECIES: hypothetical protein [unclassified Sinorhizobium]|uniref:hypothetical protein n=1 Tax=unclassified Sinorhizobium TaxID=2613772 RepID=UPI003524DB34